MAVDHRLEQLGAAHDLVVAATVVAARLDKAGSAEVADWVQTSVATACRAVWRSRPIDAEVRRVSDALALAGRHLGLDPAVGQAVGCLDALHRWWCFDPIRDGHPPTLVLVPSETLPPRAVGTPGCEVEPRGTPGIPRGRDVVPGPPA